MVDSMFTHAAESRYAPIEDEVLAVAGALYKARYFVLGCENLILAVYHKPLLKLLADRTIDIPNPRLRNIKAKTVRYHFRVTHVTGMKNKAADAMSRTPVGSALRSRMNLPDDNAAIVNHIPSSMHTDVLSLLRRIEPDDDDDYIQEEHGDFAGRIEVCTRIGILYFGRPRNTNCKNHVSGHGNETRTT